MLEENVQARVMPTERFVVVELLVVGIVVSGINLRRTVLKEYQMPNGLK